VIVTGVITATMTQPLLATVTGSIDRRIRRSLSFDVTVLEQSFVEYYMALREKGKGEEYRKKKGEGGAIRKIRKHPGRVTY
jgi:hypothetical protein